MPYPIIMCNQLLWQNLQKGGRKVMLAVCTMRCGSGDRMERKIEGSGGGGGERGWKRAFFRQQPRLEIVHLSVTSLPVPVNAQAGGGVLDRARHSRRLLVTS